MAVLLTWLAQGLGFVSASSGIVAYALAAAVVIESASGYCWIRWDCVQAMVCKAWP